eukprot:7379326-Prymnesium_polylepis.1
MDSRRWRLSWGWRPVPRASPRDGKGCMPLTRAQRPGADDAEKGASHDRGAHDRTPGRAHTSLHPLDGARRERRQNIEKLLRALWRHKDGQLAPLEELGEWRDKRLGQEHGDGACGKHLVESK